MSMLAQTETLAFTGRECRRSVNVVRACARLPRAARLSSFARSPAEPATDLDAYTANIRALRAVVDNAICYGCAARCIVFTA